MSESDEGNNILAGLLDEQPEEESEGTPGQHMIEILGDEPEKGWLVHVALKTIEAEVKSFGPFGTEDEAREVAELIMSGAPALTFTLLPSGIDSVLVEPAGRVKN